MSELPPRAEALDALRLVVLPAVAAAAGVFGGSALVLSRLTPRWREWMPPIAVVALAAALLAGNYFRGAFPWAPDDRWWHWGGPALIGALTVAAALRLFQPSTAGRLASRVALAYLVTTTVLPPDDRPGKEYLLVAAVAVGATWWALDRAGRAAPLSLTAGMGLVALGGSALLLHHKTIGFSDALTAVGLALLTLAVLGKLTRTDPSAAGAAAVLPVAGLLALGRVLNDSDIPLWVFGVSGGLALLLAVPKVGRVLVPVGVAAVVVAAMQYAPLRFGDDW